MTERAAVRRVGIYQWHALCALARTDTGCLPAFRVLSAIGSHRPRSARIRVLDSMVKTGLIVRTELDHAAAIHDDESIEITDAGYDSKLRHADRPEIIEAARTALRYEGA